MTAKNLDSDYQYEHEIIDSNGNHRPFSISIDKLGARGRMVWPAETSELEHIRRVSATSLSAFIVWPTMKIRCWVSAMAADGATDLEIKFAFTPYRYRIDDQGKFAEFIKNIVLPSAPASDMDAEGEQAAPPGHHQASLQSCGPDVRIEDRSNNQDYAYFFLVNDSNSTATVTIRRSWIYDGLERSDTPQHILYPGAAIEVFSFPRRQSPKAVITHCSLASGPLPFTVRRGARMSGRNDYEELKTVLTDVNGNEIGFFLHVELEKRTGVLLIGDWSDPRINLEKLHRFKSGVGVGGKTRVEGKLQDWRIAFEEPKNGKCSVSIANGASVVTLNAGEFEYYWFENVDLPKR